jgi:hypothetical protein
MNEELRVKKSWERGRPGRFLLTIRFWNTAGGTPALPGQSGEAVVFDARFLFEYAGLVWMAFLAFVFLY